MILATFCVVPNFASTQERPPLEKIKALQSVALFYKVTEGGLELNWDPASAEPSGGVKVTCSTDNAEPLYPYDGYVAWLPGVGHSSCVVPLDKASSNKPRYYRVCSVRSDNHSEYVALSNVVLVPPLNYAKNELKKEQLAHKSKDKLSEKFSDSLKPKAKDADDLTAKAKDKLTAKAKEGNKSIATTDTATLKRPSGPLVADHKCTNISAIPESVLAKVRKEFSVWYGHTSHGSQITSGMEAMNRPPFNFNSDGSNEALRYNETGGDLGHHGDSSWEQATRQYLDRGGKANVIVWSWCGGASDNTPEGIARYLALMNKLEVDYPGRIFIYMTGHLDGSGENGNLNKMNNLIRDYCKKNSKVLFDFAAIESYDPSGKLFLDMNANDNCDYHNNGKQGNWAREWLAKNPQHGLSLPSSAAHTEPLNGALKGRAFWYLLANLSGWQPH